MEDKDQPEIRVLLMIGHLFIERCLFFQADIICVPKIVTNSQIQVRKYSWNLHLWVSFRELWAHVWRREEYLQLWATTLVFPPQFVLKKWQSNPANIRNVTSGLSVTMADWPAVKGILASEWSFILTCPLKLCRVHTTQILKWSLNKLV